MKRNSSTIWFIIALLFICGLSCIKAYDPPVLQGSNNYLVVEGYLNASPDSPVIIQLSRTRNLTDTITSIPELNALVMIESENGSIMHVQSSDSGTYIFNEPSFQFNMRYRINIMTENGQQYQSDFVPIRQTPEIGSLNWKKVDNEIQILLNSSDPLSNTRYYRWNYSEAWQYTAFVETFIGFRNGQLYFRDSLNMVYTCYDTEESNNILIGNSLKLSNDIIADQPIATIPEGSTKLSVRYSILIKQYALTKEAYSYWQILQKNSQDVGSIFDALPSQLQGNIRCITNPEEPVIGFISGGTVSEKRLFITRTEVNPWTPTETGIFCEEKRTRADSAAYYLSDGSFLPIYYFAGGVGIALMPTSCADCRVAGGVIQKPSYW